MDDVLNVQLKLDSKQQIQEEQYVFPYHYLDIASKEHANLWYVENISLYHTVIELLKLGEDDWVLDAGCGDGRFCYELKKMHKKIMGVDFSEAALRFARAFNPEIQFLCQDLTKLDNNKQFDKIVLLETLEHIPPKEIENLLLHLLRILKKSGTLILSVPSERIPLHEKHYQHFTPEKLEQILSPHFKHLEVLGHGKTGLIRFVFQLIILVTSVLYCFISLLERMTKRKSQIKCSWIRKFFDRSLKRANAHQAKHLIVKCSN